MSFDSEKKLNFISFSNEIHEPHQKLIDAYHYALKVSDHVEKIVYVNSDNYQINLIPCKKFLESYVIENHCGILKGLLTTSTEIALLSISNEIDTVAFGSKDSAIGVSFANKNYVADCIEIVEIKKGDKVWISKSGKIIIGKCGTYSPPKIISKK